MQNDDCPLEIAELSPATFHQYITMLLERIASEYLPGIAGMLRIRGRMTDPGVPKGSHYYGVKITDDGEYEAKADIPASLLQGRGVRAGQQVILTGRVSIRSGQYGVEVRLAVTDLQLGKQEEAVKSVDANQGRMTIERMRSIPVVRNQFPVCDTTTVALIHSSSPQAQVSMDCRAELDKLGDLLVINPIAVNMLDPVAIASAIRTTDADILILIRGGGDSRDFEVFDNPRVVQALADCTAFRLLGLGHTGNRCLLDFIADKTLNTPAQAGAYVRERIEIRRRKMEESQKGLVALKERMAGLERARDAANVRLMVTAGRVPLWWVNAAFLAGLVLVWVF